MCLKINSFCVNVLIKSRTVQHFEVMLPPSSVESLKLVWPSKSVAIQSNIFSLYYPLLNGKNTTVSVCVYVCLSC